VGSPVRPRLERLSGVPRLLAVGDVQSNHAPLMALLSAAGYAIEREGLPVWTAGDSTLLFLGDLLDGGTQPAEVLWLAMRLHEQAAAAGGRVVLVQGNHEMMLFDVTDAPESSLRAPLQKWFANGGLETLLRLAASLGLPVSERLIAAMYSATFGDAENDPEVLETVRLVRTECAPEIAFLKRAVRPAVVVNGALLAVHGSPNLDATSLDDFVCDDRAEALLAWSRDWLADWRPGLTDGVFVERVATLKKQLDDPGAFNMRMLLFAHTGLPAFSVPGFRDGQFRVGRLIGPDVRPDLPAIYDVMTMPRAARQGGALGGLLIDASGVTAVYGSEMSGDGKVWPARETIDGPDPAFASALQRVP
jgi:hypothetical protein